MTDLDLLRATVEQGAACAGQGEVMEGRTRIDRLKASALCADCPVFAQCDELALTLNRRRHHGVIGVWAGKYHGEAGRAVVVRPTLQRDDHGTRPAYQAGCGCPICLAGEAERTAARRARRRAAA